MVADTDQQTYIPSEATEVQNAQPKKVLLWDRKAESGFPGKRHQQTLWNSYLLYPETKVLKQLVRDRIDPSRDLGHSDKHGKKKEAEKPEEKGEDKAKVTESSGTSEPADVKRNSGGTVCEDCK